jgi:hypothetical protein
MKYDLSHRFRASWLRLSAVSGVVLFLAVGGGAGVPAQIADLGTVRNLLEKDYAEVVVLLDEYNQVLIRNTERLAPQQAEELRRQFQFPETLPEIGTLALGVSNYGMGLVSFLFEEDFVVEQVNLLFCEGRVGSIQVLFDDRTTFGDTIGIFSRLYAMGPSVPFGSHQPAFRYPLPGISYDDEGGWTLDIGAEAITVWDMGTREAIYQPVVGGGLITGQFWLTSRELVGGCAAETEEQ